MRQLVRNLCSICGLVLLLSGWTVQPAAAVVSSEKAQPVLLGKIEFRGVSLGGWHQFPDKVAD